MILVFFLIATVVPQDPTTRVPLETLYSSQIVYFLRLSGIADIFHSGWFILVLIGLALNLIFAMVDRLPEAYKQAENAVPPTLNVEQVLHGKKRAETYFSVELKSPIAREEFREIITQWARARVGKPRAVRDEGGLNELQLATQQGRFSRVIGFGAHLGLVVAVIGLVIQFRSAFEGSMVIDEGAKTNFIQATHGQPPRRWKVLLENGRPQPGFYVPGFEVSCPRVEMLQYPGSDAPYSISTQLEFYERGVRVAQKTVSPNHPAFFRGLLFYQGTVNKSSSVSATIVEVDSLSGAQKKIAHMVAGSQYDPGDYQLRVVEISTAPGPEGYGPSVQLELTPRGKKAERFWIFQNFPDFDTIHRKKSRYHFQLAALVPQLTTTLNVSHDPGAPLLLIGTCIALLSLLYSLFFSFNRLWFVWYPGRIAVIGWSHRMTLFEPSFERAVAQIKARIARADGKVKASSNAPA